MSAARLTDGGSPPARAVAGIVAAAILAALIPGAAFAAPLTVCAFSFNTPYELQAFRFSLPDDDFDVVDLSPHLSPPPDPSSGGADAWLPRVCRPDLRCDVVLFSAEFAGR